METTGKVGIWGTARKMAEGTPPERNRYVDFLRALSILAVITGHWLITAVWFDSGGFHLDHTLRLQPATQWLTLLFQVMPVFFFVGGYSNAASWESALRSGTGYGPWLAGRLRRLVGPVVPLMVAWIAIALLARVLGVAPGTIHELSKQALVPLWFLVVYILVILAVPWTHHLWRRFGGASFWGFVLLAVAVDAGRFWGGHRPLVGWLNYLFIWLGVHQMAYMWRAGAPRSRGVALLFGLGGAGAWALLHLLGPYPVSMVSVPGEAVSNTLPPDIMLLALACAQWGFLMAIREPMQRWLGRPGPWTATILVNSLIMTIFLWHVTAMVLLIGGSTLLDGAGLHLLPGSGTWWATRPLWIGTLVLFLIPFVLLFGGFERLRSRAHGALPAWRIVPGALLVCYAMSALALGGVVPAAGGAVRYLYLVAVIGGALLLDALPVGRRGRDTAARG